jgi:DNA mismatch repair protein MutS2
MVSHKTLKSIEYDKIMQSVSNFAVLRQTKKSIAEFSPVSDFNVAQDLLDKTEESYKLLYEYSVGGVYFFDDISDELTRADAGGTLNNAELLRIASALKSARLLKSSIEKVNDSTLVKIPEIASRIYQNHEFEKEITDKIISPDEISDNASVKLASIRRNIKNINVRIRERLNSYVRGTFGKYLQENVVTIRQDRCVIPVKSEYRSFVKGFIHDQSSSGSTVFIEPEQVMELNNELKKATLDEKEEIIRILADLSYRVTFMSDALRYNAENISEIDEFFARAEYSFKNKCSKPILNNKGIIDIKKGRHPLIPNDRVVPVDIKLGENYNFLLITGPNTGGKTVTLKLTGLFPLMASSGLYIPASDGSIISIFSNVFCDIGDEQSIEQNLSTFSSHIKNIINIINSIDDKSLVLLDELGAGTDPEEGSSLALAIIDRLLCKNCFGIITTHYSKLKEFAVTNDKITNASMEFDAKTLSPKYKLNVGIPGSSNAIDIAKTLGLDIDIIENALSHLSSDQVSFENVLKEAEKAKRQADELQTQLDKILVEQKEKLRLIEEEKQKISVEREKIYTNARFETKRIVADKLEEAEEIIEELKSILKKANLESKEIFKAGELRNRLKNSKYLSYEEAEPFELIKSTKKDLIIGNKVYVKSLGAYAKLLAVKFNKGEAEVVVGSLKSIVKIDDIYNSEKDATKNATVQIYKSVNNMPKNNEINVIGKTALEAEVDVKNFIDLAVLNGLEEIKIIHGVGQGVLLKTIRQYLKDDKNVLEFRRGKYGEGENGVTIVTLK